ncbi:MAG: hypothetical protein AAF361_07770 [Bacteroidota bacterium]
MLRSLVLIANDQNKVSAPADLFNEVANPAFVVEVLFIAYALYSIFLEFFFDGLCEGLTFFIPGVGNI